TLRGQVLPVGGIKEKVLAAHGAGLKTIILPRLNEPDLEDLPDEVRNEMKFILVDTVDEVLKHALGIEVRPITAEEKELVQPAETEQASAHEQSHAG
ncbi:MAG TPA: S16 family serine protease, partial [Anaerolineaceae bacterium]|nr:S16 family serine protease [Anaerolineaceae bacterium]